MATRGELIAQRQALRNTIRDLKAEIRAQEPGIDEIARYIRENHPRKVEQRQIEAQIRTAQSELTDVRDQLRNT